MSGPLEMLVLASLVLAAVFGLVLALRPARRELRLPREDETALPVAPDEAPDEAPHTIDLTAREIDPDRPANDHRT